MKEFSDELYELASNITNMIDFEESKAVARLVVKPGVFEELDEMKRTYEGLGDFLVRRFLWNFQLQQMLNVPRQPLPRKR